MVPTCVIYRKKISLQLLRTGFCAQFMQFMHMHSYSVSVILGIYFLHCKSWPVIYFIVDKKYWERGWSENLFVGLAISIF